MHLLRKLSSAILLLSLIVAGFAPYATTADAASAPPTILSYQGRLTDSGGNLLGGTGTTYSFQFSLWTSPTVGSGTQVWPASTPGTTTATVTQGVFNVNIGDTGNGYPDALNINFANFPQLYLQVQVSANGISSETLSPRQQLTSAVYAQVAGATVGTNQSAFGTTTPVFNSAATIAATSSAVAGLTIVGAPSQSANLLQIDSNTFANIFSVSSAGGLSAATIFSTGSTTIGGVFNALGGLSTLSNLLVLGSTTLQNFTAVNATTTQATTTNLAVTGIGAGLLKTLSNGAVVAAVAGTDYAAAGSGAFPFTPGTNFGAAENATSTPIFFTTGLQASSTSQFASANFYGNLGIGTSNPISPLEVNGNAQIDGGITVNGEVGTGGHFVSSNSGTANNPTFGFVFDSGTGVFDPGGAGSHTVGIAVNSVESARFTTAGFGIGTTSPFAALSVVGNGYLSGNFTAANITATGTLQATNIISLGSTTLQNFTGGNATTTNATTTSFAISNVSSSLLKTLSNGAVVAAIANTDYTNPAGLAASVAAAFDFTPGTNFGAAENATSTKIFFTQGLQASSTSQFASAIFSSSVGVATTSPAQAAGQPSAFAVTGYANFNNLRLNGADTGNTITQTSGNLGLTTTGGTITFGTSNGASNLFIGTTGNIGIATTTPQHALTISSTANGQQIWDESNSNNTGIVLNNTQTGGHQFEIDSSGGSAATPSSFYINDITGGAVRLLINSAGNVGIGTSTPGSLFSINGIANFTGATSTIYSTGGFNITSGCYAIGGTCLTSGGGASLTGTTGQVAYFSGSGTAVGTSSIFIAPNGNVGVGSTSPNAALSVYAENGSTNTTVFAIGSSTATQTSTLFTIDNTGRVSLGSSTPFATLSVSTGSIFASQPVTTLFSIGSSTSASANTSLFSVTSNGRVTVGSPTVAAGLTASSTGQFSVLAASSTAFVVASTSSGLTSGITHPMYLQGRYAYVVDSTNNTMQIFDVSNPAQPISVSSIGTSLNTPDGIYVYGHYAYVNDALSASNRISIFDVSNPSAPVFMTTFTNINFSTPTLLTGYGHYLFMYNSAATTVSVIDISNPGSPVFASNISSLANTNVLYAQGSYLYVGFGTGNVNIYNVSNAAAPVLAGTYTSSSNTITNGIYVQGRYGYVVGTSAGTTGVLEVVDLKNPASPAKIGSVTIGGTGDQSIYIQGRYAYVSSGNGTLAVVDVSNPAAPALVTGRLTGVGASATSLTVQGRYAYLTSLTPAGLWVYDLGGEYAQQLEAGGIEAGTISVRNSIFAADAQISNTLVVGNNASIQGNLAIVGATTTSGTSQSLFSVNAASTTSALFNVDGTGLTTLNALTVTGGATTTALEIKNLASTTNLIISSLGASAGQCLSTDATGNIISQSCSGTGATFSYPFPSNATTTGLLFLASTTIGNGTQAGGLTISGGATTTGNAFFKGNVGVGSSTPFAKLSVSGNQFDSVINTLLFDIASSTSAGTTTLLSVSNTGALTVSGTGLIQTLVNSATAFQVQNSQGAPIFLVDTTTINLVANPGFEVSTVGWAADGATTLTRVTNLKYHGVASLQVSTPATANTGAKDNTFNSPLTSTTQYTLSFYAQATGANFNTIRAGRADDGATETACSLNTNKVVTGGWTHYFCTFTTGTVSGTPYIFIEQTDATSRVFDIDAVQLQTGAQVTPYTIGAEQLRGVITAPASFVSGSNSNTAFQIQDASSTSNLFIADTLNSAIDIGTSTGLTRLTIQGTSTADILEIATAATGASAFHISAAGNVGIGTTTPGTKVSIQANFGDASTTIFSIASSTIAGGSTANVLFSVTSNGRVVVNGTTTVPVITPITDSTSAIRIRSVTGANTLLSFDTSNTRVQVGTGAGTASPALLILDTKNSTGDPTGVNGATYYNQSDFKRRCFDNGAWQNCEGWTFLGTATGATATVGPVTVSGTYKQYMIIYFISGYSATAIGRLMMGGTSISTTALTNGTTLWEASSTGTSVIKAPSIPGVPLGVVAAAATTRSGVAYIDGASGALKSINILGQNGSLSVSTPPSVFQAAGAFSDVNIGTNLPLHVFQLTVYDNLTAVAASATTFTTGTYFIVYGRNGD